MLTAKGALGSLLAVVGIGISVGGASAQDISLPHIGAIILGTAFMAQSGIIIKRFPPNPPIVTNALSMSMGAVILAVASLIAGEQWVIPSMTSTIVAFVYLTIFVTVIAFMLYLSVLNKWTASGTSIGFVLIPLVTAVIAAVMSGEAITLSFLAGGFLVILGVVVGALIPGSKKSEGLEECKDRSGQVLPKCA